MTRANVCMNFQNNLREYNTKCFCAIVYRYDNVQCTHTTSYHDVSEYALLMNQTRQNIGHPMCKRMATNSLNICFSFLYLYHTYFFVHRRER